MILKNKVYSCMSFLLLISSLHSRLETVSLATPRSQFSGSRGTNSYLQIDPATGLYTDGNGNYFTDSLGQNPVNGDDSSYDDGSANDLQIDPSTGLYVDSNGNYFMDSQGTQPVDPSMLQGLLDGGSDQQSSGITAYLEKLMGNIYFQLALMSPMFLDVHAPFVWVGDKINGYKMMTRANAAKASLSPASQKELMDFMKIHPDIIAKQVGTNNQMLSDLMQDMYSNAELKGQFIEDMKQNPQIFAEITKINPLLSKQVVKDNPTLFNDMMEKNPVDYSKAMTDPLMQKMQGDAAKIIKQNEKNAIQENVKSQQSKKQEFEKSQVFSQVSPKENLNNKNLLPNQNKSDTLIDKKNQAASKIQQAVRERQQKSYQLTNDQINTLKNADSNKQMAMRNQMLEENKKINQQKNQSSSVEKRNQLQQLQQKEILINQQQKAIIQPKKQELKKAPSNHENLLEL
jgi:hypothetical protein